MPYNYQVMARLPVDPRVVELIQRSPQMVGEQEEDFLEEWGGPTKYRTVFAKLPATQRITYAAVLNGHSEPTDISIATGLTIEQVDAALIELEKKGYVTT